MSNSAANNRVARNSILMSIRMVIVLCISLYTTRALLGALGVENYGIYNVVCGFVSMFTFLNTSMSNGIQRFYNFENEVGGISGANRVYNTSVVIQLFLAVIIILLTETFGVWYLENKMIIPADRTRAAFFVFQFSVVSFFFIIVQSPYAASVLAHERMDFFAFVSVLDAVLKLCVVLALPKAGGDSLVLYGAMLAAVSGLNLLLYYWYCKKNFPEIKLTFKLDTSMLKSMLGFSGWNVFGSLANVLKEQGINLVLNFFFGPVVNAARAVAMQVSAAIQGFVSNLSISVRPQVIRSYASGDIVRTMNLTYSISKIGTCLIYVLALPIMAEIDTVLDIWLGIGNIPAHAPSFIVIVLMTSLINNLNAAVSGVVHASGKMKDYQLWGSLIVLSSIPISYVLLKMGLPPESPLIVVFLSMALAQIVSLIILKSIVDYNIKDYCRKVICPLLLLVLVTIWIPMITKKVAASGVGRLILSFMVTYSLAGVGMYYVVLNSKEKHLVNELINKIL